MEERFKVIGRINQLVDNASGWHGDLFIGVGRIEVVITVGSFKFRTVALEG